MHEHLEKRRFIACGVPSEKMHSRKKTMVMRKEIIRCAADKLEVDAHCAKRVLDFAARMLGGEKIDVSDSTDGGFVLELCYRDKSLETWRAAAIYCYRRDDPMKQFFSCGAERRTEDKMHASESLKMYAVRMLIKHRCICSRIFKWTPSFEFPGSLEELLVMADFADNE